MDHFVKDTIINYSFGLPLNVTFNETGRMTTKLCYISVDLFVLHYI